MTTTAQPPSRESSPSGEGAFPGAARGAVERVEEQVIVLVRRAKQRWQEAAGQVHPDLQPIGFRMLSHVVRHGPIYPGQLAEAMETDKSVVSRQVKMLCDLGLLAVEPDPEDGRCRLLVPTAEAKAAIVETRRRAFADLSTVLGAFSEAELGQLGELLERLNEGFAGGSQNIS